MSRSSSSLLQILQPATFGIDTAKAEFSDALAAVSVFNLWPSEQTWDTRQPLAKPFSEHAERRVRAIGEWCRNQAIRLFTYRPRRPIKEPELERTRITAAKMATVEHCIYCFEVLSATLENRTPMTLAQVRASWAEYPKGLELDEENIAINNTDQSLEDGAAKTTVASATSTLRPALDRLSGSSTPASTSTSASTSTNASASSVSTNLTTPDPTFTPIGIGHRTHQRPTITESPLFVTWNTLSKRDPTHRSLRGCIGTFESMELSEGIASYALTSALHDVRFNPISLAELPTLEVSVTLLTDFENAKDAMDWELGVHGLRISFYYHHRKYGACYLPDVAPEQGWDKEETVVSLMRKAGWGGRRDRWREVNDMKVVRFQGMAESLGWEEYKLWKEWVKKTKA